MPCSKPRRKADTPRQRSARKEEQRSKGAKEQKRPAAVPKKVGRGQSGKGAKGKLAKHKTDHRQPTTNNRVSRSIRRRLLTALGPVLRAATAAEAELLSILASRATETIGGIEDLAKLCDGADEARRLASLMERIRSKDAAAGEEHRERARALSSQHSAAAREIGPLPDVEDVDRKESCRRDFRLFCKTYHADWFPLEWSESQLIAISLIEETVLRGGLHADALERGVGKTTLCIAAVEWAIFYGHHKYAMLLAANDDKASELLDSIKTDIETNARLHADFPEVCHAVVALEGIVNRCKGQTLDGAPTGIEWRGHKKIVLPTIPDSPCSGSVVKAVGWSGAVRGAVHNTRDGRRIRPGLLMMDDLQTDESARSPQACGKLLRTVNGGLLGLAGPGQKISAMFPCTIIEAGDAADQITDREKNPEWHGQRSSMIRAWPEDMELWEKYHELRQQAFRARTGNDGAALLTSDDPAPSATAFYDEQRRQMDAGFEVSWPARKLPWERSAQQSAMHLYFRNRVAFFSEYQNLQMTLRSPAHPSTTEDLRLDPDQIAVRLSGYARGVLPPETQWVTGFIDVHQRALYWMLCAWAPDFTGWIVDYGTFPETKARTYYVSTFRPALKEAFPGAGQEGALTAGLKHLTLQLLAAKLRRSDGVEFSPQLCPIDTGYMATTIRRFVESSQFRPQLLCSLGRQCGPNDVPFREYKQRPGERLGDDWLIRRPIKTSFQSQHLLIDTYAWKSFATRRLLSAPGDPGAVTLFGQEGSRVRHDFLGQHFTSEYAQTTEGRFKVNVWSIRPGQTENHYWDCFVGNCVAANILGARLGGAARTVKPVRAARTRVNLQGPDGRSFFVTR